MTLAGLWDRWKSPEGQWVVTCAIVTTTPNAAMAALHDRMPVILGEADWPLWLGEREGETDALLRPCPEDWLKIYADHLEGHARQIEANVAAWRAAQR